MRKHNYLSYSNTNDFEIIMIILSILRIKMLPRNVTIKKKYIFINKYLRLDTKQNDKRLKKTKEIQKIERDNESFCFLLFVFNHF